jgi:hypothetical protein
MISEDMNPIEMWRLPVPASSLVRGPSFHAMPKRECSIGYSVEGVDGAPVDECLIFQGVEAFKCTYLTSCNAAMFTIAYGKLVSLQQSPWLAEVLETYSKAPGEHRQLLHLVICFDDGPCYEFICANFKEAKP